MIARPDAPPRQHCPCCRASYRATATCTRCGADLSFVMILDVAAWRARNEALDQLARGRPASARASAERALDFDGDELSRQLFIVSTLLDRSTAEAGPAVAVREPTSRRVATIAAAEDVDARGPEAAESTAGRDSTSGSPALAADHSSPSRSSGWWSALIRWRPFRRRSR